MFDPFIRLIDGVNALPDLDDRVLTSFRFRHQIALPLDGKDLLRRKTASRERRVNRRGPSLASSAMARMVAM
ncbi:MAG: hypothetical protein IPL71_22345 [Anaerolineales bacterium]|uniref:hypothetical protein n=1 Tax=Candidatus Villigracilis proximus TaxID=3140683 RepID=UPI0031360329|nr:hypothetical protein [Anaerolineales bacterium]